MVHRWSTQHLIGGDPDSVPNQTVIRTEVEDLLGWAREALDGLVAALADAPADLRAMTFLNDCPSPLGFWARRQAHETTMHMVDALSAVLGRFPSTGEVGLDTAVAVDGLDELLRGFFTRGRSKLFDGTPFVFVVAPDDSTEHWVVRVDERLTVDPPGSTVPGDAEATTLRGSAAGLYLALWNRGGDVTISGATSTLLDRWRSTQKVRWS
jgi:hypothetical protein